MNFRQTAALGLSGLILSSNFLPAAVAATMAASSQTQLPTLAPHPLLVAMAKEGEKLLHPLKEHRRPRLLKVFDSLLTRHRKSHQLAQSVPLVKTTERLVAVPLEPEFRINPAIIIPAGWYPVTPRVTATAEPKAAEPKAAPQHEKPSSSNSPEPTGNMESSQKPDAEPLTGACALKPQASQPESTPEVFQMLASDPLEKLVALKQDASPKLDTSPPPRSPEVKLKGRGTVKALKSGISQHVSHVELTVGKAEVIYLSKPAGRIAISNPDVASAVVISPTQIQLIGKSVGVANLLIWNSLNSPDHTAVDINVHRDVSVLVNQLKYVDPGIQIAPMAAEDTVILTGQAESRETAQLAIEMAKAFFNKNATTAGSTGSPNSQAPGSALPGIATNVINLIKIKGEPSTKIELLRQRLAEIDPNIKVEVVPGPEGSEKVILTGRVATASIVSKALNLASVFYGQPGIKLVTAQGGNEFARMQVTGSGNSQNVTTTAGGGNGGGSGGVNVLQGSVLTDATGNVISMLEVAQKPQIKCSIKFLELNKTALNALGGTISGTSGNSMGASWSGAQSPAPGKPISTLSSQDMSGSAWQTLKNAAGVSQVTQGRFNEVYQNGITQVFSLNNQLTAAIQALQEKKQVRTLAEPTLTMLSGEQGSFLAGGEVPIAFVGGQGQVSIEYKEFGIRLNLLPTVTDDGKIQMQVAPEVSALDQTKGVSTNSISVPAFVSRRMQTTLLVEPGQSFALAGLYSQEDTDSISRFPGLGALPIIGAFFRNSWKDHRNSEMVVIIKPEIIMTQTGPTRQAQGKPSSELFPVENKPQLSQK
ncbi:MAG TPA: pilus assembly protein N-terminal domain-containing protein [Oculatellaceae cyanobacterium]|jgi:Flp pilus assembly secretin CpaC